MEIHIPDKNLDGFNNKAREKLSEATNEFAGDLIEEANRLESTRNTTGDDPEITSSMVNDAKIFLRRGLSQPKKGIGNKVLRTIAAVLALVVGIMYDTNSLQESGGYLLLFILVIAATILTVTISIIKE